MPDPKKMAFFEKNRDAIVALVDAENARRKRNGVNLLTDADFEVVLDEMMKKGVDDYKFSAKEIRVETTATSTVSEPAQVEGAIRFEITPCENGYVLHKDNTRFIFKTAKELMKVFELVLFKKEIQDASRSSE